LNKALIFVAYISVSLLGLYKLKSSAFGLNMAYMSGMAFYVAGFFLWLLVLRWYPLSIAFPLAAGTLIVGSQLVGIVSLSERYDGFSVLGVSLILAGIAVLGIHDFLRGPT